MSNTNQLKNEGMIKMQELQIAEEKGLRDVRVFQVCECEAVAAYSLEEAVAWYKEHTGLADDELYSVDEMKEVSLSHEIYDSEAMNEKITVQEVINRYWMGKPFIAFSSEW